MLNNSRFLVFLALVFLAACAKPVANFTASETDRTAPADVSFDNQSVKAETYFWDFGDGTTSTKPNPNHRYSTSGNYLVTLRAEKGSKSGLDSQRIQIIAPPTCMVEITTPQGKLLVQLSNKTPKHRDNFIKLAEKGYFDDLLFHRVIDGFMIQGGDPDSKGAAAGAPLGSGGPGYQVPAEFDQSLAHVKGAIAAARTGGPSNPEKKSSGSQFYIVSGREVTEQDLNQMEARKNIKYSSETRAAYLENGGVPFLDADYTVFGHVIEGMDVIDKIGASATDSRDRPKEDVTMQVKVVN